MSLINQVRITIMQEPKPMKLINQVNPVAKLVVVGNAARNQGTVSGFT